MGEMEKVLSCFVIGMLLMSVVPVSVFASKPIPTRIHLHDATFEWHTNQSLIAKLVDENGQPLSGKEIIFYVNTSAGWQELGYSTTNESGIAKYDIFVTMPDGNYTFKAVFKGDMRYFSSLDTAVIRVKGDVLPVVAIMYLGTGITLAAASYFLAPYIASYFGSAFSTEIVQSVASNLVANPANVEKAKKVLEEMMEYASYQQYYYYMTQKRIQDSKDLADLVNMTIRELIDELNVSEDIYNKIFPIAERTYKTYAQKIYLNLEDYVKSGVVDNIVHMRFMSLKKLQK